MSRCAIFITFLAMVSAQHVIADVPESEIAALREQVRILTERLDQLEQNALNSSHGASHTSAPGQSGPDSIDEATVAQIDQLVETKVNERMAASSWTEKVSWQGDMRYRYENIHLEGADERNRQRIRARANLKAAISATTSVGIGLASGGDDPVSTNQTLGGGGSTKGLSLDLAYFQWRGLRDTTVVGGKFKNLLYRPGKNGLLWDGDWNPEGLAFKWDNDRVFVTGIGTWIESDSDKFGQEFSYGLQAGARLSFADDVELTTGVGYYRFDTAGKPSFYGDDDDFFGNSFDPVSLTYLYDYHEVEAFADLEFQLFNRPASLFADYVVNLDPNENDSGYAIGFKTGNAKTPGTWDLAWIYQDLEADAALGLVADSDFGGGGTDAKGHIIKGSYAIHEKWNAQFTYFINEVGISDVDPRDFDRLQLDLNFKY